jgi:carbohydrate-selective porin OprB
MIPITRRRLLIPLALMLLVIATSAFSCDPQKKRTVEQNVTLGLRVTARAVEPGIETMRSLREAGEADAATNLRLAEAALKVNSALQSLAQAALDGGDAQSLADQLDAAVNLARDLEAKGTLGLKNGRTKLVFELGVIAAKNGLVIARDELKGSGGAPVKFTLDDETKKSLRDLLPVFVRNDKLLREAVARLSAL